jgi:hypothetical protein
MPLPPTEAIVAAYGPRDAWEAAQIAKAAALDASSAELCRMVAAGGLSPEQAVALGQGIVALDRASRLALGALQRRRTRAANKTAAAPHPAPTAPNPPPPATKRAASTDPRVGLSPEKAAIWDRFLGNAPPIPHPRDRKPGREPHPQADTAAIFVTDNPMQPGRPA